MERIGVVVSWRAQLAFACTLLVLLASAGVASAATYAVNDTTDAPQAAGHTDCFSTNNGTCTLRAAVQASDESSGQNTITLPTGTYTFSPSNAASTAQSCSDGQGPGCDSNDPSLGDLDVLDGNLLTITGAGAGSTVVNANGVDRAFAVQSGGSLTLSGMALEQGVPAADSGGSENGGAIYDAGGLTTTNDVTLTGNSAPNSNNGNGGAIMADAGSTLSVNGATFSNNTAFTDGGAIDDNTSADTTITNSAFDNNLNDGQLTGGGAIAGESGAGSLSVDSTSFSANNALTGGAIYWAAASPLTVKRSTFANNLAGNGGGGAIWDIASAPRASGEASMTLTSDLFTGNSANRGGALLLRSSAGVYSLSQDEFDGNAANIDGGAVDWEQGTFSASASSFISNTAGQNGGALNDTNNGGTLSLTNVTISGNTATSGGGIYFGDISAPATMTNDTIAHNTASQAGTGGGIESAGDVTMGANASGVQNTIIADNTGGDCGNSSFSSGDAGFNMDSDNSCFSGGTDQPGHDPLLGKPADNGGPAVGAPGQTETLQTNSDDHSPSPPVDSGTNTGCPSTDSRGVSRDNDPCDMGAYEAVAAGLSLSKSAPSTTTTGNAFTYTVTVSNGGPGYSTTTKVADQLPSGETLWGATPSQGSCTSSGSPANVTCSLGNIASGSNATITLVVSEANAGSVTNTANATNDQGSNASASATTQVNGPPSGPTPTPSGTAPTAITGSSVGVGQTVATITGQVNPGGQSTAYFFQYGTNSSYGQVTPVQNTSSLTGTSAKISNLSQATGYHYRLVAINANGTSLGLDRTLRTGGEKSVGKLLLDSRKLTVRNGSVLVPFTCVSNQSCEGNFTISKHTGIAKTRQFAPIACTKSSATYFRIAAEHRKMIEVPLVKACLVLLQTANNNSIQSKLTSRPRSGQLGLIEIVTLTLG